MAVGFRGRNPTGKRFERNECEILVFFFYRFPEKQDSLELTVGATLHTLTAIVYRSYWHDLGEQSMLNTCDISKDISVNHVISNEVQ